MGFCGMIINQLHNVATPYRPGCEARAASHTHTRKKKDVKPRMIMSFQRFTYTIAVLLLLASSEARNTMASGQKAPTEGRQTRLVILGTR